MAFYLLQEDGFKIALEDGTGFILLEDEISARITQVPVEALVAGDSEARITQTPVEVLVSGDASARITQVPIEVILQNTTESVEVFLIDYVWDEE